jgi:prolipoprotein diacylglyceryltransferase/membrane-associated phospholipid phosphatase
MKKSISQGLDLPTMIPRLLYALLFCAAMPLLLWAWAWAIEPVVRLPNLHLPWVGALLLGAALALIFWAWAQLWFEVRGLPMNAYPPTKRAVGGPFAWLNHPIYTAAVIAWTGFALITGSSAALWLGTPLLAALCAAMVWGYEAHTTHVRLGPPPQPPRFRLCKPSEAPPNTWDRVSVYVLIFLPWLVLYLAIGHLHANDAVSTYAAPELRWPVIQWAEALYAAVYPLVILAPLALRTRSHCRHFCTAAIVAMVIAFWCYLALPFVALPKDFTPDSTLGLLLQLERAEGINGRASMPSFHVYWAFAAAAVWGRAWPRHERAVKPLAWALAAAIAVSCVATGMHSIADVLAGALLFLLAWNHRPIYAWLLARAECIANAWCQLRLGRIEVLIHALYAGVAAALGVLLIGTLAGPSARWPLVIVALGGLIGAGAWGQIVTGGKGLARPFGYFGQLLGSVLSLAGIALLSRARGDWPDPWILAAACATATPLIQAVGRLRCLVQGCCHGRPVQTAPGIHYHHPRSRVCAIAKLHAREVHPTPLYSILANIIILGLLLRLWSIAMPAPFIAGAFLILSGLARFVEEHYRGEPNTPVYAGLRLYQWLALACILGGGVLMALSATPGVPVATLPHSLAGARPLDAVVIGLLYAIAMGVHVPGSTRRFARLG